MSIYRHIVVGTDFSASAPTTLREACLLAIKHNARLSLVHVVPQRQLARWQKTNPSLDLKKEIQREAKELFAQLLSVEGIEDINTETHVLFGPPTEQLLSFVEAQNADLIVVGKTGATLSRRLLLGSTAERLIRHAPTPIMIVHEECPQTFQHILAPIDLSSTSQKALETAARIAKRDDATLHVLHVHELLAKLPFIDLNVIFDTMNIKTPFEQNVQRKVDAFLQNTNLSGKIPQTQLAHGVPHDEILLHAKAKVVDLIVIGSVGRTGIKGLLLGNTAERVARNASCSLFIVKPTDENQA